MDEVVEWGVRMGSSVLVCPDAPSAFRIEAWVLARRGRAQVVTRTAGEPGWVLVDWASVRRADPRLPVGARKVAWWDRLGRGRVWWGWVGSRWGRNRSPFGRRGF